MKTSSIRTFAIAALATTALAGMAFGPTLAVAAQGSDHVAEAAKASKDTPNLKLSEDGYHAMRDIRAARISIFNGNPGNATKYVEKAEADLGKAKTEEKLIVTKADAKGGVRYIPIDGQIVIAQDFVATPDKAKHIAAGNEKLKQGKTKEALDELKLANVDIGFSRVLMPLASTESNVKAAADLLKDGKFYEANMALKTAEDGMNVDTVMLVEAPKAKAKTGAEKTGAVKSTSPAKEAAAHDGKTKTK